MLEDRESQQRRQRRGGGQLSQAEQEAQKGFASSLSPESRMAVIGMIDHIVTPMLVDQWRYCDNIHRYPPCNTSCVLNAPKNLIAQDAGRHRVICHHCGMPVCDTSHFSLLLCRLGLVKVLLDPDEGPVLPEEDPDMRKALLASIQSYQTERDVRPTFRRGEAPARYRRSSILASL